MLRLVLVLILFTLINIQGKGQNCPPGNPLPLSNNDCGQIVLNLSTPSIDTCSTDSVKLEFSTSIQIDTAFICWKDNKVDTIDFFSTGMNSTVMNSFKHLYNFPTDTCPCNFTNTFSLGVEIFLVKRCTQGAGFSCLWASYGVTLRFQPKPLFIVPDTICVGVPLHSLTSGTPSLSIPACPFACANGSLSDTAFIHWDFGDITPPFDTISTSSQIIKPPDHIYANPGLYQLTLTITNSCGTATYSHPIRVLNSVFIAPSISQDTCSIAYISALLNGSNNVDSAFWSVSGPGPTNIDTLPNLLDADITIFNPGTYQIHVTAYDYCCPGPPSICSWDTTINILAGPSIQHFPYSDECSTIINFINDFNLNTADSLICSIDSINQLGGLDSVYYYNGNSPATNYVLNIPGTYIITASAINACDSVGIKDTIVILSPTTIAPIIDPPGSCSPDSIVVVSVNTNNATTFSWTASGGGISPPFTTLQTPVFNINQPGTYTISLQTNGCCSFPGDCDTSFTYTLGQGPSINLSNNLNDACDSIIISFSSTFSPATNSDTVHWNISTIGGIVIYDTLTYNPVTFPPNYTISTPDTFVVSAIAINICDSVTVADTVILYSNINVVLPADTTLCFNEDSLNLNIFSNNPPIPGYWLINSVQSASGFFNPSFYSASIDTIIYVFDPGILSCQASDTFLITVLGQAVNAGSDVTLCSNGANYTLQNFTPPGGTWSGSPSIVNSGLGIINPQLISPPSDTLIYTVTFTSGIYNCPITDTLIADVFSLSVSASLVQDTICTPQFPATFTNPLSNSQATWNFGDGTIVSTSNPTITHSYMAVDSIYYISALITQLSQPFCSTTAYDTIVVRTPPFISFTVDTNKICQNDSIIILSNNSIFNSYTTYTWNDGNGNIFNTFNPGSISYPPSLNDSDTYVITVIAANICGSDTILFPVTVYSSPHASFTYSSNNYPSPCSGDTIEFQNFSIGGASNFWWIINGDTVSSNEVPNDTTLSTYDTDSIYVITLIAANKCGTSAFTDTILVHPSIIIPSFSINAPKKCVNDLITFISNVNSYQLIIWKYGDGNTDTGYVANHTYGNAGIYIVTQIVVGYCGTDSLKDTVNIQPPPNVSFSTSQIQLCSDSPVCFTNASSGTGTLIYSWSFGDGDSSTSTNPCHQYLSPGIKNVTLVVTDLPGYCTDSITIPVNINQSPVAQINLNTNSICLHDSIQFSSPSPGQIFVWNMGDGNIQNGNPFYYHYSNDSTYNIQLTVVAANGCSDTISTLVNIWPDANAIFTWNQSPLCEIPSIINFNNQSTDAGIYNWNFGIYGTSADSIPALDTLTVSTSFTATLTANNIYNCPSTSSSLVTFTAPPFANFSFNPGSVCNGTAISLTNLSVDSLNSVWLFSDGGTSLLPSPTYTFSDSGAYTITLIVTNDSLCHDTTTQTVYIAPDAIADFSYIQSPLCQIPDTIYFYNGSSNAIYFAWDFGIYGTSNLTNPNLDTLTASTSFNVTLISDNQFGCADTISKMVTHHAVPVADFSIQKDTVCLGTAINFINLSYNAMGIYNWYFGDGSASTLINPSHTYNATGIYEVWLVASGDSICKDTARQNVFISPYAEAHFYYTQLPYCGLPKTVQFNSSDSTLFATTYEWIFNFAGFTTSTVPDPTLNNVNISGIYPVTLIVNNFQDCPDTLQQDINLFPQPIAAFQSPEEIICINKQDISFDNLSVNAVNYLWSFGNGDTSNQFSIGNYTYGSPGMYNVSLIASNSICSDTATRLVTINPIPDIAINSSQVDTTINGISGKPVCDTYQFLSTSSFINLVYSWQFGDGNGSTDSNPNHSFLTNGNYLIVLTVTDENGCENADSISDMEVNCDGILLIPNVLAPLTYPSETGLFIPKGKRLKEYSIEVYSPNGQLVWFSDKINPVDGSPAESWNGSFGEKPLPQGAYVWKVKAIFTNNKPWNGNTFNGETPSKVGTVTIFR